MGKSCENVRLSFLPQERYDDTHDRCACACVRAHKSVDTHIIHAKPYFMFQFQMKTAGYLLNIGISQLRDLKIRAVPLGL